MPVVTSMFCIPDEAGGTEMSVRRITNDARARISDEAAEEHGTTSIVSGKQMWDNISADDMPRWQFRQLVAWLAVFLCMLEIVILAPFALIFRGARHQIVQMVWLVRMCGHGLPSYQALLLLVRGGPGSLGTGRLDMSDESIHLPSDKHQQERFQSSYLSNVFGFPFYLCKGDLDVYGPKRLAIALFVLKLIGKSSVSSLPARAHSHKPQGLTNAVRSCVSRPRPLSKAGGHISVRSCVARAPKAVDGPGQAPLRARPRRGAHRPHLSPRLAHCAWARAVLHSGRGSHPYQKARAS